jgi:hypothetical protein
MNACTQLNKSVDRQHTDLSSAVHNCGKFAR